MQGIYAITNVLTDTVYYGSSSNIEKRITNHKADLRYNRHKNPYLQNSFNKYGFEAFVFAPVQIIESEKEIIKKEQEFIDKAYFLGLKLFNFNDASGWPVGQKHTEKTKKKLHIIKTGMKHSELTKQQMKLSHIGKRHSDLTKKKISKSMTGKVIPKEVRQKISISKINKAI